MAQTGFALRQRDELDLSAGQLAIGGEERHPVDSRGNQKRRWIGRGFGTGQRLVNGAGSGRLAFLADSARQIALRVDVDEEDALVRQCERCGQIDGRGGFSDPTLLIGDGDDPSHVTIFQWLTRVLLFIW